MSAASTAATVTAVAAVALAGGAYVGFRLADATGVDPQRLADLVLSIELADAADDAEAADL